MIMGFDSDKDGKMTVEDFLVFYKQQCIKEDRVKIVRSNLASMGFRDDLKPMPEPGSDPNCLQVRKGHLEMPRFKLSNDQRIFGTLLELVNYQSEVSREARDLINMACTNQT